jgi:hypothetical protein
MFGLIEAYTPDQTFASLKRDVDLGLLHVAETLGAMLPQSLTPAEKT